MATQTEVEDQILLIAPDVDGAQDNERQLPKDKAPNIPGFRKVWADEFRGPQGSAPNADNWNRIVNWPYRMDVNNEKQGYVNSNERDNVHLTGDGELVIIPRRRQWDVPPWEGGAEWDSGRLECKHSWACEANEKMILQAEIKLGEDPNQMGIWPAFWALGESIRKQGAEHREWPRCGEWDILEVVNGRSICHNTPHFTKDLAPRPGSPIWTDAARQPENPQYTKEFSFDRTRWHTFSFRVNRAPLFENETITWFIDGRKTFQLTGADVGQVEAWKTLTRDPYFPILNVAVGGEFPDNVPGPNGGPTPGMNSTPTGATQGGFGCRMQVRYVAVYKSKN